jgi:dTDP-4-amino-4,6-dideoxygalactose transaminase
MWTAMVKVRSDKQIPIVDLPSSKTEKKFKAKLNRKISVMRPLLPKADRIHKYLEEIDNTRWYTNFGPLVMRFEQELADLFNVSTSSLITLSSGTAAIYTVLRALNIEQGSFCIVPSWTFVATAAAPITVGLKPYFVDVEEDSWTLDPASVKQSLKYIPGKIGAVIVVAPFGRPVNVREWDQFTKETGIAVVIDAAAAFDSVLKFENARLGNTPVIVSMHATKTFGMGEGAFVISQDKQLMHHVRQLSNYGFTASREIFLPGLNSKLSEYAAAVGLAALEEWEEKRQNWQNVTSYYLEAFKATGCDKIISHRLSSDWVNSTCNIRIPEGYNPNNIIEQLSQFGIEARRWWTGCHRMKAYENCSRFALPITEKLCDSVIAIPFSVDMTKDEVEYIVEKLHSLFN